MGYIFEFIKDATTNNTFELIGVAVTRGYNVQEVALPTMSRTIYLNSFSEMLFHEMLKVVENITWKTTVRDYQCSLLYLLTLSIKILEIRRNTITETGISCGLCCLDMLYTFIIKKVFLKFPYSYSKRRFSF